jgi:addiction module HigA family antidote
MLSSQTITEAQRNWRIAAPTGPKAQEWNGLMAARDYTTFASPLAHPGEILREDYLPAVNLSPGGLARAMGLKDRSRIEQLVREQRSVTSDTALRLARVFSTSPEFWMNLQAQHDLSREAIANREALNHIQPLRAAG